MMALSICDSTIAGFTTMPQSTAHVTRCTRTFCASTLTSTTCTTIVLPKPSSSAMPRACQLGKGVPHPDFSTASGRRTAPHPRRHTCGNRAPADVDRMRATLGLAIASDHVGAVLVRDGALQWSALRSCDRASRAERIVELITACPRGRWGSRRWPARQLEAADHVRRQYRAHLQSDAPATHPG